MSTKPPKIDIERGARHLPPASLGRPYTAQLITDADDAKFVACALADGLSIDETGRITGLTMGLGPHRFEVCALSPTRGKAWRTLAVTANPPLGKQGAAATPAGVPLEQVQAMIAQALAQTQANVDAQIADAVAAALAAREKPPAE